MANFIGLVYATLKEEGIDTKGMSTDEAVAKFKELKGGESESPDDVKKKLNGEKKQETKKPQEKVTDRNKIEQVIKSRQFELKKDGENTQEFVFKGDNPEDKKEAFRELADALPKNVSLGMEDDTLFVSYPKKESPEDIKKKLGGESPIEQKSEIKPEIQKQVASWDDEMKYRMLSRMESDVKYYLGASGRSNKALWAGNPQDHIQYMEEIYSQLKEKPDWLSETELRDYKEELLNDGKPSKK